MTLDSKIYQRIPELQELQTSTLTTYVRQTVLAVQIQQDCAVHKYNPFSNSHPSQKIISNLEVLTSLSTVSKKSPLSGVKNPSSITTRTNSFLSIFYKK